MPNNRRGLGYIGAPGQVLVQRPNLDAEMDWETPAAPLIAPDTPWTVNHNANFFQLTNLAALVMNTTETLTSPRMDFIQVDPTITITSINVGSLHFFEIAPSVSVNAPISLLSCYSESMSVSGDGVSAITNLFGTSSSVLSNNSNLITNAIGIQATVDMDGSGAATNATGVLSVVQTSTGSIGTSVCYDSNATNQIGSWTTAIGFRCTALQATTNVGMQLSGLAGATNTGIQISGFSGTALQISGMSNPAIGAEIANAVSISADGTIAAPAASTCIDMQGVTGAELIPRMTTAQKNALTAQNGMRVYDTTLNQFQGRENGAWVHI